VSVYEQPCRIICMKKRALIYGAPVGLAVGIVMFLIAMSSFSESSVFYSPFDLFNRPVLSLVAWMHRTFHGSGLYELLAAFLCCWGLLGFLLGLGWWALCGQKHRGHQNHVA
jgi:hypothetical protein